MSVRRLKSNSTWWLLVGLALAIIVIRGTITESTASAQDNTFVFTAHGDHGQYDKPETLIGLNALSQAGAAFSLGLGDLSYESVGDEARWCQTIENVLGPTYPFEIVMGNHEDEDRVNGYIGNFVQHCPDRMQSQGIYGAEYYFDYPAREPLLRVILIGAGNDWDWDGNGTLEDNEYFDYDFSTPSRTTHMDWLADKIDSARSAGIQWVVVGMHKNCLTIGEKSCEIGPELMNLLIEKKVDLVLQGHDHNYQRSKQLSLGQECHSIIPDEYNRRCVADDGSDGVYEKGAGTIVIITGHFGGKALYEVSTSDSESGYFAKVMGQNGWFDFLQSDKPHPGVSRGFVKFDVNQERIVVEHVSTTNPATEFSDIFSIVDTGMPSAVQTTAASTLPPTNTPAPAYTRTPTPGANTPSTPDETTQIITFIPVADAYVHATNPDSNYGSNIALRTDASPDLVSYLRFDMRGLTGEIKQATLRVYANSASSAGYEVQGVANNDWTESTLTYSTAPPLRGDSIGATPEISADTWTTVDVTALVTGNGLLSLALITTGNTAVNYSSREGVNPPELLVEFVPGPPTGTATSSDALAANGTPVPTQVPAMLSFVPVMDAYVHATNPESNYGSSTFLRTDASPEIRSYLQFDVQGVDGTIKDAKLWVYVNSVSSGGYDVLHVIDQTWTEADLTYQHAPMIDELAGSSGPVSAGRWSTVDVTALVSGDGLLTLALTSSGSTAISYGSRESSTPPRLVIASYPRARTPISALTTLEKVTTTPVPSETLTPTQTPIGKG